MHSERTARNERAPVFFLVVMLTVGLVGAPSAFAAFVAERRPPELRPTFELVGYTAVTQVGGGLADPVQGFGHSVPLAQAMRMLLPLNWSYVPGAGVGSPEVSWTAGQTWLDVLAHIGDVYRLRFLVDWVNRVVFAERARLGTAETRAVATTSASSATNEMRPVSVERSDNETLVWQLERGGLREQLRQWAQRADYVLHWPEEIADIGIQVPAALHGDFLQVVQQVGEALEEVRAGVRVRVYPENRALVIQEY